MRRLCCLGSKKDKKPAGNVTPSSKRNEAPSGRSISVQAGNPKKRVSYHPSKDEQTVDMSSSDRRHVAVPPLTINDRVRGKSSSRNAITSLEASGTTRIYDSYSSSDEASNEESSHDEVDTPHFLPTAPYPAQDMPATTTLLHVQPVIDGGSDCGEEISEGFASEGGKNVYKATVYSNTIINRNTTQSIHRGQNKVKA